MCDYFSLIPKRFFRFRYRFRVFRRNLASISGRLFKLAERFREIFFRPELLIVTFEETVVSHWSVRAYRQAPPCLRSLRFLFPVSTFDVEFFGVRSDAGFSVEVALR